METNKKQSDSGQNNNKTKNILNKNAQFVEKEQPSLKNVGNNNNQQKELEQELQVFSKKINIIL